METAISLIEEQNRIYNISFRPIHKYIAQILPYLEMRQEIAKRYYDNQGRNDEADKMYLESIKNVDLKITEVLNINNLINY